MKKIAGIALVLILLMTAALAETVSGAEENENTIRVEFGSEFSLELPAGWLSYAPDDEMAESGVIYCLSDAAGEKWLYVQEWTDECADIDALLALIAETTDASASGKYTFGETEFVVYEPTTGNVSCCATLLGGRVLNFIFTPQNDRDFMLTATQIITSFEAME